MINIKEKSLGNILKHLYLLYPNEITQSETTISASLKAKYPLQYVLYFRLLVHFITILNKNYRMKELGRYISEKEDIITSLSILEHVFLKDIRSKEETSRYYYQILKNALPDKHKFSRKTVQEFLELPRTTIHKIMKLLESHGYVERTGGYKNKGYTYRLK